ncbi:MAG: hypothetical protein A3H42_04920 [Deltaproteobacteria bacterium RIFCSPLOWO2_02_FULL_46_8]|nr:MAG: hypothetical protein A3H42_04920 [Deltaproteobacteria bacterium RIFCSPLOWO2_02_FULL_46_8]
MSFFQGKFGKIYYQVKGEGFPVIFISGMGASHQEWFCQIPSLSKKFKVITFDNAGSGRSVHPDCEISIHEMAEDVSTLVQYLKLERVVLIGSSMGGLIAQSCLELFPKKIAGLVLSSTFEGINSHMIAVLSPLLKSRQSAKVRVKNVLPLMISEKFIREEAKIVHRYISQAEEMSAPREVLQRQVRAVLNFSPHPPRSTHKMPMLILVGAQDPITPPSLAEDLQKRYPQAQLHLFEGAKHLPHIERAQEFNDQLEQFLTHVVRGNSKL